MKKYAKLIWEYVIRYTLLDLLTTFFLLGILYILMQIIFIHSDTYRIYAFKSLKLLALLYITAILISSCWCHIKLLKYLEKNEVGNKTSTFEENSSVNNIKVEREETC